MKLIGLKKDTKEVSSSRRWMQMLVGRQATKVATLQPVEDLVQRDVAEAQVVAPAESHVIFERSSDSQKLSSVLEEIRGFRA